jgi:hypothetical protein
VVAAAVDTTVAVAETADTIAINLLAH